MYGVERRRTGTIARPISASRFLPNGGRQGVLSSSAAMLGEQGMSSGWLSFIAKEMNYAELVLVL
jgi:hypothetical protein